ncbi:HNH endonuclease signature motif containing protein [Lacisediminihabitans sp.]|jgi:hypothetical protein|uniref:HNH endonuclease signature motif containing protein n=1 Tax=Lacisediminihabitans sp. TaxID=2787631 RepID=UPI002F95A435
MNSPTAAPTMSVNALTGEIGAPDCLGAAGCLGAANSLGAPDSSLGALTDSELLHTLEAAFARRHEIDAELVRLASQVVERSRSSLGPAGLASRLGQTSPAALLTDIGRIPSDEAFRLCRVGEATGTRMSLVGERMPPLYPALTEALAAGGIPVASANWIVSALSQVAPQAHPDEFAEAERQLAAHAADRSADEIRKLATRFRDMLDVDGIEPREEALAQLCSLRRIVRHNGMKRYVIDLDPLGSAHLDASIDAAVTQAIRSVRFEGGEGPDACGDDREQLPDPRTLTQIAAAAIVEIARHANSCTSTHVPVPSATIVVRMTLESLMSGLGEAHIDGIEQPISAGTARRLAADAHLIPMVLGGPSEVLDLGASRRLFSRAQRLALAERDGGCAVRGCHRPPSYTEAHHIQWWSHTKRTDLDNGILLCSKHHHGVHRDGWGIEVIDNVPWFVPPSSVDVQRTPRRGGRLPEPELPEPELPEPELRGRSVPGQSPPPWTQ